ncbi:O-antigen ligase [Homoserinimonas sp. OAct 916]|uniref:O-antigen ligase family protein n=1 Tax=Homoserinimonas sp. OAct 916 TaxID=2211450 RepID=UPI000DBEA206|nr:O-antigen ligase family protein [Homoserinimonas sp. OAct 916]
MAQLLPAARVMISKTNSSLRRFSSAELAGFVFFVTFAGQALRNLAGWAGFAAIILAVFLATVSVLGPRIQSGRLAAVPVPLLLFLGLCAASLTWSKYGDATLLGLVVQWMPTVAGVLIAVTLDWQQLLDALWSALKWILGLSLVFELFVAVVVRGPLMPVGMRAGAHPETFAWSTGDLFSLGPIQGIVANRNLLAFVALLAIITLAVRWFERPALHRNTGVWLGIAALTLALTRSATVTIALFTIAALAAVVLLMRHIPDAWRRYLYPGGALVLLVGLAAFVVNSATLFSIVGRDDDMTGRMEIWEKVTTLASQQPMFGWGWVGYWAPWVKPFHNLVVIDGTTYLQAHNALLDVWLQLGLAGVLLALFVAVTAGARAWRIALSPVDRHGRRRPFSAITLLPLLLMAALLIQSLTESRLLIEGNWLLFVLLACAVKADAPPFGSSKQFGLAVREIYQRNSREVQRT